MTAIAAAAVTTTACYDAGIHIAAKSFFPSMVQWVVQKRKRKDGEKYFWCSNIFIILNTETSSLRVDFFLFKIKKKSLFEFVSLLLSFGWANQFVYFPFKIRAVSRCVRATA